MRLMPDQQETTYTLRIWADGVVTSTNGEPVPENDDNKEQDE